MEEVTKNDEKRMADARENLKKMLEEIQPFLPRTMVVENEPQEQWIESSSVCYEKKAF